jgi:hypothetical protein
MKKRSIAGSPEILLWRPGIDRACCRAGPFLSTEKSVYSDISSVSQQEGHFR